MVKQASDSPYPSKQISEPVDAPVAKRGWLNTFASLAVVNYRWYWISGVTAGMTLQMRQIARGWLVYGLSGSPLDLALVMASFGAPMTLLSLVGGAVADRLPKRTLIFATNLGSGVSSLLVGLLVLQGNVEMWHLLVIGFLDGTLMSFNMPSRQGMIPALVGRDLIMNASALSMGAMNASRVVAPALAGVLIPVIRIEGVFFVMAALNVLAALTILMVTVSGTQRGDKTEDWRLGREVLRGVNYVVSDRTLLSVMALAFVAVLLGMGYFVLMPAFVVEALDGGSGVLGLLLSVSGVGAVAGSIALASLGNPRRKGALFLGAALVMSLSVLAFTLTRDLFLASAMMLVVGFATSVFMSTNIAILQLLSSPEMYGRVMSISMMNWGLMPLGVIPVSIAAERIGTPDALALAAALLVGAAVVFTLLNGTVRRLEV
ncbi:MAG: MFS transporter [Chloroflexi bacterium]|nr:MFS transporter [Chloroflexota bacterium]